MDMAASATGSASCADPRPTPQRRFFSLDLLRTVAILAVITVHVSAQQWGSTEVTSGAWLALNTYDALNRWGVGVFVMISGALFLDPRKKVSTRRIYRKSIPRLLVALAVWNAVYALYKRAVAAKTPSLMTTFKALVLGNYHLWFIYMLIGLYLLVPVLRKITEDRTLTRYFLGLGLVLGFAIPTLYEVANQLAVVWESRVLAALAVLLSAYKKMHFTVATGYAVYFVLGYYLHAVRMHGRQRMLLCGIGVAGFVVTTALSSFISRKTGAAYDGLFNNLTINVLAEATGVFVLAQAVGEWLERSRVSRLITFVAEHSFGIYLVHDLVRLVLQNHLGVSTSTLGPAWTAVPSLVIIVFVVSLAITVALRKVPRVGTLVT